ncbi:pyridoxamine 5'-phosphate oxidase family protein [Franzmannia qiaohouensis]|uniref:Pyridoxamine 5'-phosphate oxidase family protein n=1 Tax=Franzmannia qiaohouensis TaxID=1329370 RepID=A0ABU1HH48_9GAMM|nr:MULTISPECIES: pyridoxamine 5'-phosphate oxidase family protein [Halomonas]APX92723.1 phosphohydrolase [Halomonas sp. 1513]MDR5906815.1 pyridoxamine 5'-phosphate oxidase family protein [Halomonas qiaohouensis]
MIRSIEELRALYPPAKPRALQKQLSHLDQHCRRFIALSPFVVLASGDGAQQDASPRGGAPGFVKVVDDTTLLIPDSPGNNRLDSLSNIIASGRLGLLFLIPGVDESLRINGAAEVSVDEALLAQLTDERRTPRVVIRVTVEEAYLHCAKALMRSRLWADDSRRERAVLPSMGKMIQDQTGGSGEPESQAAMLARYRDEL